MDVVIENSSSVDANAEVTLFNQPAGGTEGTAAEETVEIDAAATKTVTLSWDTSDAAPGAHTFRAGVALVEDPKVSDSQDSASTITIGALTYGVSITAFDVPSGPATQGDVIPAKVTVKNLGSVAAMFTVTLFNQPASGTEGTAAEETVEIAAAATKTVTLSWDTSDAAPGVHTFRAGVTLLDDPKVSDSQDSAATITVSPPPYAVAVTAVEVASATVIQGATVDVEVTVENQGASDANAKVRLLYVPAEGEPVTVAEKTVAIAAGESETITLSWDTSDAPLGVYTVRADATLVEDGTAADSRDAASTITIVTPPPYAVAVTAVEVTIAEAIQGETVEVDVTVANLGTSDANAKVTLLYVPDVPAQGQPGIAAEETVAVAAGESETITLSWDTSDATPGVYTIRAGVTLAEDSNAADSRDAASTITISPLTYGVSITAFDVPSGPATQGDVVDAYVTVENLGSVAAMFTVTLFNQPADGPENAADHETVEIAAAATKTVTLSWDTSDAAPGAHTFRAGVALVGDPKVSDSQDSAATITISIPPAYAVAVTAVDVPAGPVTQGDTIEVDVTVENQGASDANASVTLFYRPVDGPEETADERTVAIAAGETETITLSWDTSDAPLGVYTVRAGATLVEDGNAADSRDAAATITISPPAYAVAVTAVEVASATVIQGVTVDVEVTVENQGTSDANAKVRLLYVPTQGEPGIAADETVALAAGSAETVTLPWDTSGTTPGVYTITAGVALLEDMDAADFRDAASTITISALTYGVSITAFDVPSGPATQGDVVDADVTVENLGSVAAMFTVTLFDQPADGPENAADHETVEIAAAATKTVTLSWDTSDAAPGVHTFRAGVALVEDPKVSDSQDSAATITVSPPPYAVAVTAIEISSATAIQGATVDVEVTVENKGTSNANAKVKLLYVSAMGEPGTAAEKTVAIAAGETVEITLSWDTSGVTLGPYTIRADATLVEDSTAADSRDAVSTITIVTPPPYAVAVTAVEVAIAEAIQGETVEVEVTVANLGTSDANAGVTLRYVPAQGQPGIAAEKTVAIATGESETITLSWDTSGTTPGVYTIRAGATLAEDSTAADSRDPASTITIGALTYGVSITAFDVPSGPATQGDAVDVYVTVENLGSVAAMFTVTLFDQPAGGTEGTAAEETVEIAAAATKTVTLSWDTSDATPGAHTFRAGVTLVDDANVSDSLDSAATITISRPPYAVAVTAVEVASATAIQGATVDVEVTVENQGDIRRQRQDNASVRPRRGPTGNRRRENRCHRRRSRRNGHPVLGYFRRRPRRYTIRASVTLVEDTDVADSLDGASTITISAPPPYAVAVTAVEVASATVIQRDIVDVDVTVENQGPPTPTPR